MPECQTLKTEYRNLQDLQEKFELELKKAIESGQTEKAQALKKAITEKLQSLKEKLYPKEITANFKNPEKSKEELEKNPETIKFNIPELIEKQKAFYAGKEGLSNFNEQEVKKIFQQHKVEIQKAIETYGYDIITIIPANLQEVGTEKLHRVMSEGYAETYQGGNFKNGGGFAGVVHSESQKTRIILTHSDQNIYQNDKANPFLKATLGKSIDQLSEDNIEGLSLNEYLIFQRQYFENTQNHLDENGWTWLPKSRSASRVVSSGWFSDSGRLVVDADDPSNSDGHLGCPSLVVLN